MVELRWKLDPEHPEEYKDTAPLDAFTLQYRCYLQVVDSREGVDYKWSEWKDVPFVSKDK